MSYERLAVELTETAETLRAHLGKLEGLALAKAAETLRNAVVAFDKKLHAHLGGLAPGLREIQDLLAGPGKKHLKGNGWTVLFRQAFDAKPHGETGAQIKKEFLGRVTESGRGEDILQTVRGFFAAEAARTAPPPIDAEGLQRDFLRLGGLSDDDLERELRARYRTLTSLKKLAKANRIAVEKSVTVEKLLREIIHYARRAHQNINW